MNAKSHKLIFALLILSVLAVLLLQGFWIRNFYNQKVGEFDKTIYATLEKVTEKLEEKQNLKFIKQTIIPDAKSRPGKQNTKITKTHSSSVRVSGINHNRKQSLTQIVKVEPGGESRAVIISSDSVFTTTVPPKVLISQHKPNATDTSASTHEPVRVSVSQASSGGHGSLVKNTVVINQSGQTKIETGDPKQNEDISKLMDKMLMEIKIIDTDETDADTLKSVIQKALENKGIFIPFEFSLRKITDAGKTQVLSQSSGYDSTKVSYRSDLSANKVFTTHNFLFLQFPDAGGFVFRKMKSIILSSLLFSLIIIAIFYVTIRTILKQKKLGDMKNDFINNMTHELKTPIATISLAIDAMNNPQIKEDDEKFGQYTAILKEENQKLNAHVEHVLQMARLDKGELQLQQTVVDLNHLVQSAVSSYQLQINRMKATVDVHLFRPSLQIKADAFHIATVINNLLDNALKYSQDPCRIHISTKRTHDIAVLTIADNGIGIDESLHKKIFEKFYRVQGGNLHDVKGFGLGLSYVKSIVEKHGGSIELKSQKGKGSEFTVKLPAYEA